MTILEAMHGNVMVMLRAMLWQCNVESNVMVMLRAMLW